MEAGPTHCPRDIAFGRPAKLAPQPQLGLGPSGLLGTLLIIVIVLLLMGYIPRGF
jgi:hypothetical protein